MTHYTSRVDDWTPTWSAPAVPMYPPTVLFPSSAPQEPVVQQPVHKAPLKQSKAGETSVYEFKDWIKVETNTMVFVLMIVVFLLILTCLYLRSQVNKCSSWIDHMTWKQCNQGGSAFSMS